MNRPHSGSWKWPFSGRKRKMRKGRGTLRGPRFLSKRKENRRELNRLDRHQTKRRLREE